MPHIRLSDVVAINQERSRQPVSRHRSIMTCKNPKVTVPTSLEYIERPKCLQAFAADRSLASARPGLKDCADTANEKDAAGLEHSFEIFFAKARQYAYTYVVRRLDPLRPWYVSSLSPCSSCAVVIWKEYPIQESLLHACHSYTSQWLSERNTSWLFGRSPTVHPVYSDNNGGDSEEDDLVTAVGAWSLEVKDDCAQDALLASSEVDTVPKSRGSLIKTERRTRQTEKRMIRLRHLIHYMAAGERSQHQAFASTEPIREHLSMTSLDGEETDQQSSDPSDDLTTSSEAGVLSEQVECLLPTLLHSIQPRRSPTGIMSVASPACASNQNSHWHNSNASSGGQYTGNDRHKRKRDQRDEQGENDNNDGDESSDEGRLPLYKAPKPMPLQDTSAKLACHFYVCDNLKYCENAQDGRRYKTCTTGFRDSKELKDHHKKKHYGPKYLCANCDEEFSSSAQKASHERARPACERREDPVFAAERYILVGTSRRDAFEAMKKRKDTSHEEHWFDVWDVLFPGQQRPPSPYMPRDAFDTAFGRIGEEEIQRSVHSLDHERLAVDRREVTRLCRELIHRLHGRLRQESRAGRLSLPAQVPRDEPLSIQSEMAIPTTNNNSQTTYVSTHDGFLMAPQHAPGQPRHQASNTLSPTPAYYSALGWNNFSIATGSSNGSQPSYNTPRSNNISFPSAENDVGFDGQVHDNADLDSTFRAYGHDHDVYNGYTGS